MQCWSRIPISFDDASFILSASWRKRRRPITFPRAMVLRFLPRVCRFVALFLFRSMYILITPLEVQIFCVCLDLFCVFLNLHIKEMVLILGNGEEGDGNPD